MVRMIQGGIQTSEAGIEVLLNIMRNGEKRSIHL